MYQRNGTAPKPSLVTNVIPTEGFSIHPNKITERSSRLLSLFAQNCAKNQNHFLLMALEFCCHALSYVDREKTMALRISTASIPYRKEFNLANKHVDETLENWYDRLKALAERCEYGTHLEVFILHQFICGLDALIVEYLHAEQQDLSLSDVFDLTKSFGRYSEPVDVKTVVTSIKTEELPFSDDDHYNDNTYDSDTGSQGAANEVNDVRTDDSFTGKNEANDDARNDNTLAVVPLIAKSGNESQESPKMFECYLCHKTWKTAGNLTYHFACHHKIRKTTKRKREKATELLVLPKSFECYLCHETLVSTGSLIYHFTRYHTIGKTSKCVFCEQWISDPSNMVRHLNNIHFRPILYPCTMCDSRFVNNTTLRRHLLSHNGPNTTKFKCPECSKVFITKANLKFHLDEHKLPEISLSEHLDKLIRKKKAELSKAKSAANGKFKCDICATLFDKESALNVHSKLHNENEYLCHMCGKKMMNKRNLVHHYRVHTNEKPFSCEICGRSFACKAKCKMHILNHSGVKPYKCTHCEKSFNQKGHLAGHMNVHFPAQRRFKCDHDQCTKHFFKEEQLLRHKLEHAGIRPWPCSYCSKGFKTNYLRVEHERVHTGEKPYRCSICDKCFGQQATLRGHVKIHSKPAKPKAVQSKRKRKPKIDKSSAV